MNKKTILIGLLCIFIFSSSFAQTVSFTQSAMNTATFGNYSLEYDCYFNEIYFPFANNNKISTYTGVNNDQLNIGVSGQLSKNRSEERRVGKECGSTGCCSSRQVHSHK